MDLVNKKCIPCEGNVPALDETKIVMYLEEIENTWSVIDSKKLYKHFQFVNFGHTMSFVNKVANIAEEEGHHPVLHISYGSCEIELWTHAINGLTENDFILAAKINELLKTG